MVKNIAIIPARSGSKRIKDKNIYPFKGKPMLAWTIEAALESKVFDKVLVSTDSEKYAEIAKEYGAWVPFLRDGAYDDFSTVKDVVIRTLNQLKEKYDMEFDNYASLQVTCPLNNAQVIKEVYEDFIKNDCDTLHTCFKFGFMNPWWAFKMKDNSEANFILSSPAQSRSQDNPDLYCPSGAVIFGKINMDNPIIKYHPINWKYAIDIDNYDDIVMAEIVCDTINKKKN